MKDLELVIDKAKSQNIQGLDLEYSPVIDKLWIDSIKNAGLSAIIWS